MQGCKTYFYPQGQLTYLKTDIAVQKICLDPKLECYCVVLLYAIFYIFVHMYKNICMTLFPFP